MNREQAVEQAKKDIENITQTIDVIASGERPNYKVLHGRYPHYSMTNEVVPINDPNGEIAYLGFIRGGLKMGAEVGFPKDWLPPRMPEYAKDLVKGE